MEDMQEERREEAETGTRTHKAEEERDSEEGRRRRSRRCVHSDRRRCGASDLSTDSVFVKWLEVKVPRGRARRVVRGVGSARNCEGPHVAARLTVDALDSDHFTSRRPADYKWSCSMSVI